MSIGFNHTITFNQNGRVVDYQKEYNKLNAKRVCVILPLNHNNKKENNIELSVAINNTYPRQIEKVKGYKSDTDWNMYYFDITQLIDVKKRKNIGLSKIKLYSNKGRVKFESEHFRIS